MADTFGSLFQPQPQSPVPAEPAAPQPRPVANGPEFERNKMEWLNVLNNPNVRAGLLQFGLQMMQPIPVGQSGLGAIGQSIGAGVEASDRVTEMEQERQNEAARQAAEAERIAVQREQVEASRQNAALDYSAALAGQASAAGQAQANRDNAIRLNNFQQLGLNQRAVAKNISDRIAAANKERELGSEPPLSATEVEAIRQEELSNFTAISAAMGASPTGVPGAEAARPRIKLDAEGNPIE